jgi:hypothetical protein
MCGGCPSLIQLLLRRRRLRLRRLRRLRLDQRGLLGRAGGLLVLHRCLRQEGALAQWAL